MASITNCIKTTLKYGLPALGLAAAGYYLYPHLPSIVNPALQAVKSAFTSAAPVVKAAKEIVNPFIPTCPIDPTICGLYPDAVAAPAYSYSLSSMLTPLYWAFAAIKQAPAALETYVITPVSNNAVLGYATAIPRAISSRYSLPTKALIGTIVGLEYFRPGAFDRLVKGGLEMVRERLKK
jgi:hypothetical protein